MANFMGPMAPPQAAPPQPQKLDIRTSPGQRQQFKDFMRQRTAMMPMTSAPVAPPPMMPMMPQMPPQMPLRMEMGGDVDIFEPQNYHDGGVVSSLNRLQDLATMGSAFSEQLQSTVMGEGAGGMGMTGGFGGPSLSGPGPLGSISPAPGADVSAFFDNLRGQLPNQGLKIADRSGTGINNPDPAPTLSSSKPDNTRLLGSGDNIDQGFLNSPEFKNLDFTGPATQDMYNSPYFGTVMSGSQGRMQDAAYEAYLERTGKKVPAGTPTAPMQPARNLFSGTIEPKSYGLAGMGTTFSFNSGGGVPSLSPTGFQTGGSVEGGDIGTPDSGKGKSLGRGKQGDAGGPTGTPNFYTLFAGGQGGDSADINKIFIGSKQDTAAARQRAGSGQTAPNPTDNLSIIGGAGIDPYDVRMARLAQESSPTTAPNQLTAPGLPISPPPPPPDVYVDPFPDLPQDVIRQSDVIVPSSRSEVDIGDFPMPVQPNYPFPITPSIQAGLDSIAPAGLGLPANLLGDLSGGPLRFDDGGAVPPRNVNIKGQPHMLSYITPDEADILEALGGSGETGPMGIPSFYGGFDDGRTQAGEGPSGGYGDAGGRDGSDRGMSPGRSQAEFGTPEFAGMTSDEARDALAGGGDYSPTQTARDIQDALAAQAAAEAARAEAERARQAEAERARKARELQAQIQQAIAVSQEQKAKQQQDLANRQVDRFEAGFNQIGPTPETNISATSTTSPSDVSFGVESTQSAEDFRDEEEQLASLLGLNPDLLGIQPTTTPTTVDPNKVDIGIGSTTPVTDLTADPMAVARGMSQIGPKGIMDVGPVNAAISIASDILGLTDEEQVRSDYENRAYSTLGISPGTAEAVLGTQTETGPVTGSIGGPRGGLLGDLFGGFTPGAAGMTGMTPDGISTGAITGDQLAELASKADDSSLSGFFNNMTLSAASSSNVAIVDPATGNIVGAIDGMGRYTGRPEFNPNTYGKEVGPDVGGSDTPVIKLPDDPCPEGFVMKDGACTPIAPTGDAPTGDGGSGSLGNITPGPRGPISPVIVPSTRQPIPNTLQGPVGYGMPTAGQINPFAVSSAAMYQQMLNEQAKNQPQFAPPRMIKFQDGGPVSPDLDRAADNFLQSLMPAA